MDGETVGQIIVGVLALMSVYVQYRARERGIRAKLKRDAEVLQLLPDGSEAKQIMAEHVTRTVHQLVTDETIKRRDPSGLAIAVIFLGFGAYLAYLTLQDGWWWWVLSPFAIIVLAIGVGGFAVSIQKTERDAKGNRIKKKPGEESA